MKNIVSNHLVSLNASKRKRAMADEETEEHYKGLLHWAALQGITDRPPYQQPHAAAPPDSCLGFSLELTIFPDAGGRGLAAARDLKLGDLILRVPERALMSVRSAKQDVELGRTLCLYPSLSSVQVLCLHLLSEVAKGRSGGWYSYLLHLPRVHHTSNHFGAFETQALQVEDAVWMTERVTEKVHGEWEEARPVMDKLGLALRFSSLQAWRWAFATVSSRTLFIPWDEAGTLCPIGDFFNYACPGLSNPVSTQDTPRIEEEASLEDSQYASCGLEFRDRLRDGGFEPERGEYCFYARQDYRKGQQVLLCYGTYTNLELLEHYGFLLGINPNDKVYMGLPEPSEFDPPRSLNAKTYIPCKNLYIDCGGRPSFSLLSCLRLQAAPLMLQKTRGHLALSGLQISPESDLAVYQWLTKRCIMMLSNCVTSISEDHLFLEIINSCQSSTDIRTLVHSYDGKDNTEAESLVGKLKIELLKFVDSSKDKLKLSTSYLLGNPRFDRWKLAVEWRLSYKKILDRCIRHCSERLIVLNNDKL